MDFLLEALTGNALLAYAAVFGVLILCGLGLPLPEDIVLIMGGFLSYLGHAKLVPMLIVGFLGILVGDSITFFVGRKLGGRVGSSRFISRLVSAEKQVKAHEYIRRWGNLVVIAARFMPGLRAPTYFTCGSSRMAYWRFLLFDALAALISAPLWVILGHFGGDSIDAIYETTRPLHWTIISAVAAVVLGAIGWKWLTGRRAARAIQAPAPAPTPAVEPPPTP